VNSVLHFWWLALALLAPVGAAQTLVAVPPLQALVTDLTGTLDADQRARLEQRLRGFEARKGTQIAVLIVPSTRPEAIEQYAMRVVEQWKLGRKKVDDGALLLVAKDDRALRIEVGYGLEGVLNDASVGRLVNQVIAPRFKQGDYFGGIDDGTERMIRLVDGEPLPAAERAADQPFDIGRIAPVLLVIAVAAGGVLRRALGRLPGAAVAGGVVGGVAWLLSSAVTVALLAAFVAFAFTLFGGGLGLLGGLGGRGGGFGGGFRGGGGGGFGGGGASGRW
jgi:uncharacterized protein